MNTNQQSALLDACKSGDEVKIITCALAIAATAARDRRQGTAIAIRDMVDAYHNREASEKAYRERRLEIAATIMAGMSGNPLLTTNNQGNWEIGDWSCTAMVSAAVGLADALIVANVGVPIPRDDEESNSANQQPSAAPTMLDGVNEGGAT